MSRLLAVVLLLAAPALAETYTIDKVTAGGDAGTAKGWTKNLTTLIDGGISVRRVGTSALLSCDTAGLNTPGCVSSGAQTFEGAKTFATPIAIGSGGTGIATAPQDGGISYGAAIGYAHLAAASDAGQVLQSGGTGAPTWGPRMLSGTTLIYDFPAMGGGAIASFQCTTSSAATMLGAAFGSACFVGVDQVLVPDFTISPVVTAAGSVAVRGCGVSIDGGLPDQPDASYTVRCFGP
ncbi:MAG: hypothetical protein WC876_01895 [Candidatus Thermoplasmatota archaeon]